MKVVQTLLVRDEADIIDAHLAYHLNLGVDFVIATDHDSQDGTTEILEAYARDGYLRRIAESGAMREEEWRTRLARLAAVEHGADWVINTDADQFFWPRDGDLRGVLAAVPARYGVLESFDRVFVPCPDDLRHFAERMTLRLSSSAPINAPSSTYRPLVRVVHRGDPRVVVARGSHSISGASLVPLPNWHPIEVLHFPWRSTEQMARKAGHLVKAFEGSPRLPTAYHSEAFRAVVGETAEAHYAALAVDDESRQRGLAEGVIVVDTRVRDALRLLADRTERSGGNADFGSPFTLGRLRFAQPTADKDAAYAVEAAIFRDAQIVRAYRRVDSLEQRIASLERKAGNRRDTALRRTGLSCP